MDSYRIGTLLELIRVVAIRLAEENLRVRICVQGSMGVGKKRKLLPCRVVSWSSYGRMG